MHAFPEALVADAIREAGGEITYVTCGGAFSSFCVAMAAHGLKVSSPAEKKERLEEVVVRLKDRVQRFDVRRLRTEVADHD